MNNGSNNWGIEFSKVMWFHRLLQSHGNIKNIVRRDDIIFEVDRIQQSDHLTILCCHEYTMGITSAYRALNEFGSLDIIHIGGGWCGYTMEAKEFCLQSSIGLYVSDEMSGALWKDESWKYHRKDKDGNPIYNLRAA
jgi:hypothetical protein